MHFNANRYYPCNQSDNNWNNNSYYFICHTSKHNFSVYKMDTFIKFIRKHEQELIFMNNEL